MKSIVILVLFAASILSNPILLNDRVHEENLRTVLENQRPNFKCGWPTAGENGVPPLDPLFMEQIVITQDSLASSLTSTLTNLNLRGLATFNIEVLEINSAAKTFSYRLVVPFMTLDGQHNTRGSMIGIPVVSGSGAITARITTAYIQGLAHWRELPTSGYIDFYAQEASFNAQHVVVDMRGFGLLTNTVNRQINDAIPEYLADPEVQAQFNEIINNVVLPVLNEFTYGMTPTQAGEFLAQVAANPPPANC